MDAAYYEDLAGRLYGWLIRLQDRLDGEQAWLLLRPVRRVLRLVTCFTGAEGCRQPRSPFA